MSDLVTYIFWPNPPAPAYGDPKVMALLLLCGALVVGSFVMKHWRKRLSNSVTRKLTRTYGPAMFWFGLVGLFLTVCRVEGISYLSMRLWWGVWFLGLIAFGIIQWKLFKSRHYEIVPQQKASQDPKDKYLPKKKKR